MIPCIIVSKFSWDVTEFILFVPLFIQPCPKLALTQTGVLLLPTLGFCLKADQITLHWKGRSPTIAVSSSIVCKIIRNGSLSVIILFISHIHFCPQSLALINLSDR